MAPFRKERGFFFIQKPTDMMDLAQERQIVQVKKTFQAHLEEQLSLTAVSAPLFVPLHSGINDDLNGVERVVSFSIKDGGTEAVVVNSLAKWKRQRLAELQVPKGEGIVADMRAIRPDEDLSELHSILVDQWDWEKVISQDERSIPYLKSQVNNVYAALKLTATDLELSISLPDELFFISAQALEDKWPELSPKQREDKLCKEKGAVFIMGIGGELRSGLPHDGRAPDYDDWTTDNGEGFYGLNGDLLVWNEKLQRGFELSSMGIRVDDVAMRQQLRITSQETRLQLPFHSALLTGKLPLTIGGGIGQSRVVMFLLEKKHISEVQQSIWNG